ncbi:MAG: RNA polymerase sigma factor [Ignavibacteriales bacterium]|nr:RNA polymerase sigma factor [Ignavibacteriales bacterium]
MRARGPSKEPQQPDTRLSSLSDNELMIQVRDGDVKKLGVLFERHSMRLLNFFSRHTSKPDISEDLVQDVFFRMLKYRQTYRGEAPFTVWMYQLARNVSADYFRKWKEQALTDEILDKQQDPDPLPTELYQQTEEQEILRQALARLTPEKREVLVLSRYQDLRYEEIGRILDCPVGTVKARVHFALKDLRDEYMTLTKTKI